MSIAARCKSCGNMGCNGILCLGKVIKNYYPETEEILQNLIKTTPNDQELGAKVRELFGSLK